MKINQIYYKTYGKLNDYTLTLTDGINTVFGGNESGKSTVFNSIRSLLYGFSPAGRERHPYVNWQREEIDFESSLTIDGKAFRVMRQLRSSPKLTLLAEDGDTADVKRNDPLPWVADITDTLYESIFHLTAEVLIDLETGSWERIQERLIFNYGMDYLNKSSDVIQGIVQELNSIWRPDRRGTPRLSQVEQALRELDRKRVESELQYEALKALLEKAEGLKRQISKIDQQRKLCVETAQELNRLLPVKQKHEKIEMLKRERQRYTLYEKLSEDDLTTYRQIRERLQELTAEQDGLAEAYERLKKDKTVFTTEEYQILASASELERASKALQYYELAEQQLHELSSALSMKHEQLERELSNLFEVSYQAAYEIVRQINPVALKTALYRYMDLKQKNEKARVQAWAFSLSQKRRYGIILVISLACLVAGWLLPSLRAAAWLGAALLGVGISGIFQLQKQQQPEDEETIAVLSNIEAMFAPLKLPEYVWTDASLIFAGRIEQATSLIFEAEKLSERMIAEREKRATLEAEMQSALADVYEGDAPVVLSLQLALQKLKSLIRRQHENERLEDNAEALKRQCDAIDGKIAALKANLSEIELRFLNLGMGNLDEGIAIFERNLGIDKRIGIFEEELLSDITLYDALKRYENPELINERYIEELEDLREELEGTRQNAISERSACEAEIESIKNAVNLDELDGERQMLEEERINLEARRDQLMVMAEILKYADDKFRRENQPDILNRVSGLMAAMTLGKYQKVLISENFELQFLVNNEVIPVSKAFSKGTLNQLFLAFRLAVIEMINKGKTPLPIVLDEAFVNWDDQRLAATYKVLEDFGKRHQIIILTCHEPKMPYHLIRLPEDEGDEKNDTTDACDIH